MAQRKSTPQNIAPYTGTSSEGESQNVRLVSAGDDHLPHSSGALSLQHGLAGRWASHDAGDNELKKIPLRWTLLGLLIFCGVFWFAAYMLFFGR